MYEALKRKGFPKQNAAKISNAAVGRRINKSRPKAQKRSHAANVALSNKYESQYEKFQKGGMGKSQALAAAKGAMARRLGKK